VAIRCPYCQFTIAIKNPRPGRFTPNCPKCRRRFALIVPDPPDGGDWVAEKLPRDAAPPAPAIDAEEPPLDDEEIPDSTIATGRFRPRVSSRDERTEPSTEPRRSASRKAPPAPSGKQPRPAAPPGTQENAVGDRVTRPELAPDGRGAAGEVGIAVADDVPPVLGGYEIIKELGRGGMGAVYLARQLSLDRLVALKVMTGRWCRDPVFAARFTREAYAAAQLVHHNIVQIYDIRDQGGVTFFSMEYVEGRSLADLVRKEGALPPEEAVGYVLQAARGLKFAHDRGMIHRDVKPDNLLLNRHGIIKVADLGLVKTAAMSEADDAPAKSSPLGASSRRAGLRALPTEMTNAHIAMGSPSYMSPEQCRDAATVDGRADIYSLGCTLYVLLTARAPFHGASALEVMTKHAYEAPPRPELFVERVPSDLSDIILRMLAKDPADRYPDMGQVIQALEGWLGVRGEGPTAPTEDQLAALEKCVQRYNDAPSARLRSSLIVGFFAGSLLATIICLVAGARVLAGGVVGLVVSTAIFYFVIQGVSSKSHLFRKVREVTFATRIMDWLMVTAAVGLFVAVLHLLGMLWIWLGAGVLGAGIAFLLYTLVDQKIAAERRPAVEECERLLKRLRVQGRDESEVRLFVARFGGRDWETLYEELFGYEEKLAARTLLRQTEEGRTREKHGTWREPIIRWLDSILESRRDRQLYRHLKAVEVRKLEAQGVGRRQAEEQADAEAAVLIEQASEIKAAEADWTYGSGLAALPAATPQPRSVNVRRMLDDAGPAPRKRRPRSGQPLQVLVSFFVGPQMRFLLAALLLTIGVLWVRQNATVEGDANEVDNVQRQLPALVEAFFNPEPAWQPLRVTFLPEDATFLFDHVNSLVAGLLLLVSLLFRGELMGLLVLVAAAVTLFAHHLGFPEIGPVKPYMGGMAFGMLVALLGFLSARKQR
jgi:eukaryotic-like serine/threonine-protein kinase